MVGGWSAATSKAAGRAVSRTSWRLRERPR
jgi:hypothetical protein